MRSTTACCPTAITRWVEQRAGRAIADVRTLHASPASPEPLFLPPDTGGVAVAEAPPKVRHRETVEAEVEAEMLSRGRSIAGPQVEMFWEYAAVGARLPDMPLFLRPDRYVNAPLESTYQEAYQGMPAFWRHVLEGREPAP